MPDSLQLTDVVPALRVDLTLSDPVAGAGEQLVTVTEPTNGISMTLRGFELSIARMLNGRRTADDVINSAAQVGLPLSLESLSGFVRKLRTVGFLSETVEAPPAAPPGTGSMWEARAEWSPEVRQQYQTALKATRADQFAEARDVLIALVEQDPTIQEAQQLLEFVQEKQSLRESGQRFPTFTDLYAEVERGWFERGDQLSAENEQAQAAMNAAPVEPAKPRSKLPLIAAAVVVLLLGAALVIPFPYQAKAGFSLQPRASVKVTAGRAGKVASVSAVEGKWVDQGTELLKWDTEGAKKKLTEIEARLQVAQKKLQQLSAPDKKAVAANKALAKAQAAEKVAAAALEKEKTKAKGKRTPGVAKAEKKQLAMQAAVAKAQKVVDGMGIVEKKAGAEREVQLLTVERDGAKTDSEAMPVVATSSGYVLGLSARAEGMVESGATICTLEDSRGLVVKLQLQPESAAAVKPGQVASLGGKTKVPVEKVAGAEAEAKVENANGELKAGTRGEATIDAGGRSLLARVTGG